MYLQYCMYCNKEVIVDDKNFKLYQLHCTHENDLLLYLQGDALVEYITKNEIPQEVEPAWATAVPTTATGAAGPIEVMTYDGGTAPVLVADTMVTEVHLDDDTNTW